MALPAPLLPDPSAEVRAASALLPPPLADNADEATKLNYYTVLLPRFAAAFLPAAAKAVTYLTQQQVAIATANGELARLNALQSRINQEVALYGSVQDNNDVERRLDDERRARVTAELNLGAVVTDARLRIERAEAALAAALAAGDVTRSEGYATLLRQRVLDGGSIDSPRHAQIVSDLAASRQRDIIRRFDATTASLVTEARNPARNNQQVAAICNSMATTLGGSRIPSLASTLIYRFETVEDATLFRDKVMITGARVDIQAALPGAATGVHPALVIMQDWQK